MMWTGTVRKVRGPHTRPDVLGFYTLLTYRSGPPLTSEVVGARRLSRIKRATRKGRNPRLRLAFKHAYCSPDRLRPTARSELQRSDVRIPIPRRGPSPGAVSPSLQSVVCLRGAETTMEGAEEMTVPGSTAVPVGLRPATHLEMRCVLGESVIL